MAKILLKRGTAAAWVTANPILLAGEAGFESDSGKLKIGNGIDSWVDLPYVDTDTQATRESLGIDNVDNTADIDKPLSTAVEASIAALVTQLSEKQPSGDYALSDELQGAVDTINAALNTKQAAGSYALSSELQSAINTINTALDQRATQTSLTAHTSNTNNPHNTNKTQVGLGNVDNTSDANKPVSTAQAAADALKLDKTGGIITGDLKITNRLNAGATTLETDQSIALVIDQTVYGGAGIVGRNKHAPVFAERLGFFLFGGAGNNTSGMSSTATETWTAAARGSNLLFEVTPNGSAGRTAALKIDPDRTAIFFGHSTPNSDNLYELGTPIKYWANLYTKQADIGGAKYISGYGFPQGAVSAPIGSKYIDRNATNGAVEWVKTSGVGNTGWVVSIGDTGWRNIKTSLIATAFSVADTSTSYIWIRRVNNVVHIIGRVDTLLSTTNTPYEMFNVANFNGFRLSQQYPPIQEYSASNGWNPAFKCLGRSGIGLTEFTFAQFASGLNITIDQTYTTREAWPSTLIGTAV